MTKAKMKKYLRDTIEELNLMKEPEEFYAKQKELLTKINNLPYKEDKRESIEKSMAQWEYNFKGYGMGLELNSKMRKQGSMDKRYQKPALTRHFMSTAIALLEMHITESLLPK
jgi:hypothetical protein